MKLIYFWAVFMVAARKLQEPLDFLQLGAFRSGSQEHRTRMDSYQSLRQTIEQLSKAPGEGAGLAIYVDSVKTLLNNSMVQAIHSQFAADKTILQNAISSFGLCNSTLFGALTHPNAVRDGTGLYKGLAVLKVRHNECRGRQEAKKKEYDMCMDLKENQGQLMNASCDGNFSKFYNKVGAGSTGEWGATCDNKQPTYRQSPPTELPLVHHPGLGTVDVEGYLIEQFDYFSTLVLDYEYAEKLCYNRTRDFEETKGQCERIFKEHGDLTAECDNFQDTLDAEACTQAEQRHRACLAYDRCYDAAEKDMAEAKKGFCAVGAQEDMLKMEAKAIAQVSCMLDSLKIHDFDSRKTRLMECAKDGTWDSTLVDFLDFKECDFENPAKTSADVMLCASHVRPMNDDDLSGTPGYIAKYYTGPGGTGYPLAGSPDDAVDADNAPKTDVKVCTSTCCSHPPLDGWQEPTTTTTTTTTPVLLSLPSGLINLDQMPEHLRAQVDVKNLPHCGFCGSDFLGGKPHLVKCLRCWGTCCDPVGVNACAQKHLNIAPSCEDAVNLLAVSRHTAKVAKVHRRFKAARSARPESQKWQQLLLRARRQQAARLRH